MTVIPHGDHLIAGERVASDVRFWSAPATGDPSAYAEGTVHEVNRACTAAETAFETFGCTSRDNRAAFLLAIAAEIETRGDVIAAMASAETGLPKVRLEAERHRTVGQLKLFASHIRKDDYLDHRHDAALPDRQPLPRPDLKLFQRPVGPVAVFGASNFPLAFSTAGGDTASALAAGCPVVVKGHPAHPGTSEIVAEAIAAAVSRCGMPAGVFSLIQGSTREIGASLVEHPLIKAVSFTGSLVGGRALFNLCAARHEPIPFFGELGSVNPMFLLPGALSDRAAEIGRGWAESLAMGAGQFCTKPGIVVVQEGPLADAFIKAARAALTEAASQTMLTETIASAYQVARQRIAGTEGVKEILTSVCDRRSATADIFLTTARTWRATSALAEEVFGPLGIIVCAADAGEVTAIARCLRGQLTCSVHMAESDMDLARQLVQILERKAGRMVFNGFPTGVEVADSMVHGGPYPASTNFGATSVGTMAIRRFLRPVCYQNMPIDLLSVAV